uniref:Protein phosphatase 4 regulatory subunit 4 n=1 Tax=Ovis aries TaxID=9940 RepID=A0AC11CSC1_SHEEP
MHPPSPAATAMDFSQNSLFGYMEDLQELTIIERPVRRSLKTPEEIERLTVDEDLSDIERAVYLLSFPHVVNWRRQWHPTPVLLPGKSHGRRSLVGCRGEELDMAERLHFHFSLSCTGEGNGNPLHCSCLENLRDG